ncbi:hypothetical protein BKM31_32430 [[Actinomadura] parvosata subsp. kistnae]|uniref:Uncharacterized protein n=1 Tax=[Actinomadura] parvosata subsp. kistnae TaxID=1909395 RepID=A0A1V0A5W2_9ACTN|nr:hypothetical protein BKM31_32430 [Nonomuraea sp. ATCC 55076]
MSHDPDTVPALSEVPWPDQPPHNPEVRAVCCPECGNTDFIETFISTDQGSENALQCDHCGEVVSVSHNLHRRPR